MSGDQRSSATKADLATAAANLANPVALVAEDPMGRSPPSAADLLLATVNSARRTRGRPELRNPVWLEPRELRSGLRRHFDASPWLGCAVAGELWAGLATGGLAVLVVERDERHARGRGAVEPCEKRLKNGEIVAAWLARPRQAAQLVAVHADWCTFCGEKVTHGLCADVCLRERQGGAARVPEYFMVSRPGAPLHVQGWYVDHVTSCWSGVFAWEAGEDHAVALHGGRPVAVVLGTRAEQDEPDQRTAGGRPRHAG